jgi:hypothetical protein
MIASRAIFSVLTRFCFFLALFCATCDESMLRLTMIYPINTYLLMYIVSYGCSAFTIPHPASRHIIWKQTSDGVVGDFRSNQSEQSLDNTNAKLNADDLMEMDVVIFSAKNTSSELKWRLGAVQDDGRITTLCVWTMEPAFGNSLECLVAEEDYLPGFQRDQIEVHAIVPQDLLSYGSRQVGGGMGPGNPHGEESELLYFVDRSLFHNLEVPVKPELEIFW